MGRRSLRDLLRKNRMDKRDKTEKKALSPEMRTLLDSSTQDSRRDPEDGIRPNDQESQAAQR
jgi:hypothetical protein